MKIEYPFSQSQLIDATGFQYPEGVCQGLVVQWLISIKKNDNKQYWKDLNGSLESAPNVPLLGKGYARQAIEHQGDYAYNFRAQQSDVYSLIMLKEDKLTLNQAETITNPHQGAFTPIGKTAISDSVLDASGRYSLLTIASAEAAHAIGIHRTYALFGKGSEVQLFDPNVGEYHCNGKDEVQQCLSQLATFYRGGLNSYFKLQVFDS
ncbi:YopT-type cysteine protease domain-containing protein [Motilimonas eburnea]|uniref:YopT-type cysteine protease domain-containing protein n=1 Tax=Motilimonas eburnea TaxID=1737488 RepID=UPI001E3C6F62|nr:YopT-type cysteine protease domain-containing protein [Motilimonas eburnea]MCE2570706.1 hypothetical protein [Motilimonas eburnea]